VSGPGGRSGVPSEQAPAGPGWPRALPAGDGAVWVQLGPVADPTTRLRVLALWRDLRRRPLAGMEEAVPGSTSVLVCFRPEAGFDPERVGQALAQRARRLAGQTVAARGRTQTIPVVYGGPFGPDLPELAERLGLSPQELVRLHSRPVYRVWMVGFLPGFAYMGPLDRRLWVPRRSTPRTRVPAGSVAIAGDQTGIYPVESPGGWHVIGRTWISLWDAGRARPALLRPGDRVRFVAASAEQAAQAWGWDALGDPGRAAGL